jgi:hypothetical protein
MGVGSAIATLGFERKDVRGDGPQILGALEQRNEAW